MVLRFYKKNSSGVDPAILTRLQEILNHEKTHVQALNATIIKLGGKPVDECRYDFGYNDSKGFLSIARVLENVGASAYDGSAYLLQSKILLTTAASIATVEARHASYLNFINNLDPFPAAFESPLDQKSVFGLASPFIKNCSGYQIPLKPRPGLVATPSTVKPGDIVNITSSALYANSTLWCVFYADASSQNSTVQFTSGSGNKTSKSYYCRVPENANAGDNFLFVSRKAVYNLFDPSPIVAGPTIVYVLATNGTATT